MEKWQENLDISQRANHRYDVGWRGASDPK
jgi:hypothetical protein